MDEYRIPPARGETSALVGRNRAKAPTLAERLRLGCTPRRYPGARGIRAGLRGTEQAAIPKQ